MNAKRYRKKPIVVEAMQLVADGKKNIEAMISWAGVRQWFIDVDNPEETFLCISTLEGTMKVKNCDWIIKGVAGEFYPCKDEIFKATYEEEPEYGHP